MMNIQSIFLSLVLATTPTVKKQPGAEPSLSNVAGTVFVFDGRALPAGATVTLSSTEKSEQQVVRVSNGQYEFSKLRPGKYDLKVEADGLQTSIQQGITVQEASQLKRDLVLGRSEDPQAQTSDSYRERSAGFWALFVFLSGMLATRWFKIARTTQNLLEGYIGTLMNRVEVINPSGEVQKLTTQLNSILNEFKNRHKSSGGLRLFFCWSQNSENTIWVKAHQFEAELSVHLAPDLIRARLTTLQPMLVDIGTSGAKGLAAHIQKELAKDPHNQDDGLIKQLLHQALNVYFDDRDQRFIALNDWQNKANWMAVVGSILLFTLGFIEGHIMLFVAGAAGGLLSRMMRALRQPEFANDYGASWSTLFLSPIFGALGGWFGIGLITILVHSKVQLLGAAFNLVKWDHPLSLITMTSAFLLGFSERFFDSIVNAASVPAANSGTGETNASNARIKDKSVTNDSKSITSKT